MDEWSNAVVTSAEPIAAAEHGAQQAKSSAAHGIERFLDDRGSGLLRAAWLLTGDDHHAEDLLQTALVKSLGKYDALANDHKF